VRQQAATDIDQPTIASKTAVALKRYIAGGQRGARLDVENALARRGTNNRIVLGLIIKDIARDANRHNRVDVLGFRLSFVISVAVVIAVDGIRLQATELHSCQCQWIDAPFRQRDDVATRTGLALID